MAQAHGYAAGGIAGVSGFVPGQATFHVAGGGDIVPTDHLGVGGEIGFFNRLITGSANVTFYPGGTAGVVSPFLTGGYSRMGIGDGEGAFSAFNAGAGLHIWTGHRAGIRVELRDHFRPDDRGNTHYWSLRAGVVFR